MKNDLLKFWPGDEEVTACIRTDAEAAFEAVSQAVHQPMVFNRRYVGDMSSRDNQECSEKDLLEDFLREGLSDARVILPIVGESGTGKSHAIRWLDAQIRNLPGSEKRVVFRVPKGSSLKGVLGLLIEKLEGEKYDQFRSEIQRAQEELETIDASGMLCELLAQELTELCNEAENLLIASPGHQEAILTKAYCRSNMLPALLRNQYLRDNHFVTSCDGKEGVVQKLVVSLTKHSDLENIDDERQLLFKSDDLIIKHEIPQDQLGVNEFRTIQMLNDRPERREEALMCINRGLDGAKQRLLRLDPTVSELFDEIRKALLEEEKELILLIEDFAVLTGLQKQLLQVIIKEGVRDGKQVLCTMRTALAYTSAYYVPETVLTRAGKVYEIPDTPGDTGVMYGRVERLVGAYLNAARCGNEVIDDAYKNWRDNGSMEVRWVPSYESNINDNAKNVIESFGRTVDDYPLFPFNSRAIRFLAEDGSRISEEFVYNPRYIIQNVIQKVLNSRLLFKKGSFPPGKFEGNKRLVSSDVSREVASRIGNPDDRNRYLRLLAYWGGCPETTVDLRGFPNEIARAFNLPDISWGDPSLPIPPEHIKDPVIEPPPVVEPSDKRHPEESRFRNILEDWRKGTRLPQQDADQIRKWIYDGIEKTLSWDWNLFRPHSESRIKHQDIYLPNSAGNMGRTSNDPSLLFALGEEDDLNDENLSGKIIDFVMSVVRHNIYKSWDYDGSEYDLIVYTTFLKDKSELVKKYLKKRYFGFEWDPLPTLLSHLMFGSYVLGLIDAEKQTPEKLVGTLFVQSSNPDEMHHLLDGMEQNGDWSMLRGAFEASRGIYIEHLKNLIGARQGSGEKVYALDLSRLSTLIESTTSNIDLGDACPRGSELPFYQLFKDKHSEARRLVKVVEKEKIRLINLHKKATQFIGEKPNASDIGEMIVNTMEQCRAVGVGSDSDIDILINLTDSFKDMHLKKAMELASKLHDAEGNVDILSILGTNLSVAFNDMDVFLRQYEKTEKNIRQDIEARLKLSGNPLKEKKDVLLEEIRFLEEVFEELSK